MNMRDLKEMMLVIANGSVGVVSSWNRTTVFVHFWDTESGCFEQDPAGCPRDRVEQGGMVHWDPPRPMGQPKTAETEVDPIATSAIAEYQDNSD